MSKRVYENLKAGLEDALAYAQGNTSRAKAHVVRVPVVDVKNARKRLGLSQDKFAKAFGVSPATVRKWEQGTRRPQGPARVLLNVIDKEPDAVIRALRASS